MTAAWLAVIPYAFQILAFILQRVGASNDVITAFQKLVDVTKNDGLITQQTSDKFADLHKQLMDQTKGP